MLLSEKNNEADKNLKILEEMDKKNEIIIQLEKDSQRKEEEVKLRKDIIDSMSQCLLKHEHE